MRNPQQRPARKSILWCGWAYPFKIQITLDSVDNGELGLVKADNSQWQDGDTSHIANIQISFNAASYGQDATSPGANLSAVSTQNVFDEAIANGQGILLEIERRGDTHTFYVYSDNITKQSNYYNLLDLKVIDGKSYGPGQGYSWNIRIKKVNQNTIEELIDLSDKLSEYVDRNDLKNKETDRWASYNNAFIGNSYRRGDFCFFSQTSGIPTTANAIGQPDIANRNAAGVIAVSATLRTDRDPNKLQWADANVAADYKVGDILYFSIWNNSKHLVKVVLTSGGTLVGTGDGTYIYFIVDGWELIGTPNAVTTYGDYFRIANDEPSEVVDLMTQVLRGCPAGWRNCNGRGNRFRYAPAAFDLQGRDGRRAVYLS